jgi:hypothetical protein
VICANWGYVAQPARSGRYESRALGNVAVAETGSCRGIRTEWPAALPPLVMSSDSVVRSGQAR